jgi:hypothetical protein
VDGIRVNLRMIISADAEQRFDTSGVEVLQLRGAVVDDAVRHPPLVVRFRGQRRAELYRWAKAKKHLSVEGSLEVKTWTGRDGHQHTALLVEATNIFPLSDVEPSKVGVYSTASQASSTPVRPRSTKAQQMDMLRKMLGRDDG